MKYWISFGGGRQRVVELVERLGELLVSVDGEPLELSYEEVDALGQVVLLHAGRSYAISIEGDESRVEVTLAGHRYGMDLEDERERAAHLAERARTRGGGVVKSVMPGVVVELLVEAGQEVAAGDALLILEAMKMQNEISAPADGTVAELHVAAGQAVASGQALLTLRGPEEA